MGAETHTLVFARALLLLSTEPFSLQSLKKKNQMTGISVAVDGSRTLGFSTTLTVFCV